MESEAKGAEMIDAGAVGFSKRRLSAGAKTPSGHRQTSSPGSARTPPDQNQRFHSTHSASACRDDRLVEVNHYSPAFSVIFYSHIQIWLYYAKSVGCSKYHISHSNTGHYAKDVSCF